MKKAWRKKASSESRKELQEKSWSVGELKILILHKKMSPEDFRDILNI